MSDQQPLKQNEKPIPAEVKAFMDAAFNRGERARAVRRAVLKKFNIKVEIR